MPPWALFLPFNRQLESHEAGARGVERGGRDVATEQAVLGLPTEALRIDGAQLLEEPVGQVAAKHPAEHVSGARLGIPPDRYGRFDVGVVNPLGCVEEGEHE